MEKTCYSDELSLSFEGIPRLCLSKNHPHRKKSHLTRFGDTRQAAPNLCVSRKIIALSNKYVAVHTK
jgi:hypothetical protein